VVVVRWAADHVLAILAVVGIAITWWIYHSQQATERRGALAAIRAELDLHHAWVGTPYQPLRWPSADTWWSREQMARQPAVGIVNKLSTVAVDAAIDRGPALFINPQLVTALVGYRQRAAQFTQLIDNVALSRTAGQMLRSAAALSSSGYKM
jgi:hypothetical protein